jgi:hypothetical protein
VIQISVACGVWAYWQQPTSNNNERRDMKAPAPQGDGPDNGRRGLFRKALGVTAVTAATAASVTARADPPSVKAPGGDAFGDPPKALMPAGTDFELPRSSCPIWH